MESREECNVGHVSSIGSRVASWQAKADGQVYSKTRATAPLSPSFRGSGYQNLGDHQFDPNYGCPIPGSKTEFRGKQAGVHVSSEVIELCEIIKQLGTALPNGTTAVRFGDLFEFYTRISNKLVGMLMRARRQGLIQFEGEMLFQRRDDDVQIFLLQMPDQLLEQVEKEKCELKKHLSRRN